LTFEAGDYDVFINGSNKGQVSLTQFGSFLVIVKGTGVETPSYSLNYTVKNSKLSTLLILSILKRIFYCGLIFILFNLFNTVWFESDNAYLNK
ncbi:MAG TPA: hypothetical protein PKH20_07350, partial [Exilispira sp.]|nr:hypothetical protein [Exilispira sp.]